jgi:hypothetical protein
MQLPKAPQTAGAPPQSASVRHSRQSPWTQNGDATPQSESARQATHSAVLVSHRGVGTAQLALLMHPGTHSRPGLQMGSATPQSAFDRHCSQWLAGLQSGAVAGQSASVTQSWQKPVASSHTWPGQSASDRHSTQYIPVVLHSGGCPLLPQSPSLVQPATHSRVPGWQIGVAVPQSAFDRQATQVFVVVSHSGAPAGQSAFTPHSPQVPPGRHIWPASHCAPVSHSTHVPPALQMGRTPPQSAAPVQPEVHMRVTGSQDGVAPEQSPLSTHPTQPPLDVSQTGRAPPQSALLLQGPRQVSDSGSHVGVGSLQSASVTQPTHVIVASSQMGKSGSSHSVLLAQGPP